MIPGMIEEDDDRPIEMKPKLDVLEYWSLIKPELPGINGLCTQVTAFLDEPALGRRSPTWAAASTASPSSACRARWPTARVRRRADRRPVALRRGRAQPRRILIPTRDGEQGRFNFKCDQGATYGMTQLLFSDTIVGFLTEFAKTPTIGPRSCCRSASSRRWSRGRV